MSKLTGATRMALVRCVQYQHAALAVLAACLDDPECDVDRATVDECISAVTAAQAVVRETLRTQAIGGQRLSC